MQNRKVGLLRNSSTIRGVKKIKTITNLFHSPEERNYLLSIVDQKEFSKNETRERARFASQDAAKALFEKKYYKAREKLAAIFNKNRQLTELRLELQHNRAVNNMKKQQKDLDRTNGPR
ncbi:MAG: hypothetical protein PHX14_02500 [Syntrophomonadaceae bacterium]|nr:hypothetical protein [Syntrophomonadaceae bacterium]